MRYFSAMRAAIVVALLSLAMPARADVAPDTPEDWSVDEPSWRLEDGVLYLGFVVRNDGGALRVIVDPDTSVRTANGRFVEARARRVTVDDREMPIVVTQRGPRQVRATEPFDVPEDGSVRVAIECTGEGSLEGSPSGITVHQDGQWIGVQVIFDDARAPIANQVEAPVESSGCGCRAASTSGSPHAALPLLALLWLRRRP